MRAVPCDAWFGSDLILLRIRSENDLRHGGEPIRIAGGPFRAWRSRHHPRIDMRHGAGRVSVGELPAGPPPTTRSFGPNSANLPEREAR